MSSQHSNNQPGRGSTGRYYEVTPDEYGRVWRAEQYLTTLQTRPLYRSYVALATLYMQAGSKRTADRDHRRRKATLRSSVSRLSAVCSNDRADLTAMRDALREDLQSTLTGEEFDDYCEDEQDVFD